MVSQALKSEVTNDPQVFGYNGVGSQNVGPGPMSHHQLADSLNLIDGSITRIKPIITGTEAASLADPAEYTALLDPQKSQWLALVARATLDPKVAGADEAVFLDIWPDAGPTRAALNSFRNEQISRSTEIDLPEGIINAGDIEDARA